MIIMQGDVPQLCMNIVPLDERQDICVLNFALRDIEKYTKQFGAAVHLYDYCCMQDSVLGSLPGRPSAFGCWRLLACRDAVMSLLNFRGQIEAARNISENSAYLGARIDRDSLGEAHSKFNECFPDFAPIRDAAARTGEDARASENHSSSGDYIAPGLVIRDTKITIVQESLQDRTFTCAHQGKLVHCEVSENSTVKMQKIMYLFFGGFLRLTQSYPPASAS
ncbi:hypothetical protein [Methylocella sp.]|jgi:hypothetical protein|uniref:hypothetical protein n=1 Tax=Methylocella sp. TaxID=1978226 RepID=UPI003C24895D